MSKDTSVVNSKITDIHSRVCDTSTVDYREEDYFCLVFRISGRYVVKFMYDIEKEKLKRRNLTFNGCKSREVKTY